MGRSALLVKADIKSAFRLLPVIPEAFNSLGFYFQDEFYFDRCLPMGYSLSCHYFDLYSSFVQWVVSCCAHSDNLIHYLDDFLFICTAILMIAYIFSQFSRLYVKNLVLHWLKRSLFILRHVLNL